MYVGKKIWFGNSTILFLGWIVCAGFWGEDINQAAAAVGDALLVEAVVGVLAFGAGIDEVGVAEDGEVMGDGGLADAYGFDDLSDVEAVAAAQTHDLLAGGIGEGFGKGDCIG